ncbi:MAG: InlB B-repeat-containing protein [Spirochaetales bacterium]|nr:InlB B-repeat-containing protein [Spirochaetales bacterium]
MENEIYIVTYDGNSSTGGSVPVDSVEYSSGSVVTVQANTGGLTKSGYEFIGWNTASDGSGTPYEPGQTLSIDASNVILYARWNGSSVTYDGNGSTGGSVPAETTEYTFDSVITVLGNIGSLVKSGYVFDGWNTASDGSGTSYSTGSTFTIGTTDITLYAEWLKFSIESIRYASDAAEDAYFGSSVGISGDYAIIGAEDEDTGGDDAGAAYIFKNDGSENWSEIDILYASDAEAGDKFGSSVSISGNYAIVGADGGDTGGDEAGSAYIFKNDGSGNWSEIDILYASDAEAGDKFACSVSISGNYAIVGANRKDTGGYNTGVAYIFKNDGSGNWSEIAILHAPDTEGWEEFGGSVSISGDHVLIGATGVSPDGAAYIFRNNGSDSWDQTAFLQPANASRQSSRSSKGGNFGCSVSISDNYAIIGADFEEVNGDSSGAAHIFSKDGAGNWSETAALSASDADDGDSFGCSVGISGNYAIVGDLSKSVNEDGNIGAAYIFKITDSGNWRETAIIHATDAEEYDRFGSSVGISDNYAIVGATGEDSGGDGAGAVYIYK